MKKLLALLLCLCLGASCGLAGIAEESSNASAVLPSLWEDGKIHQIERKTFPLYVGSPAAPYLKSGTHGDGPFVLTKTRMLC